MPDVSERLRRLRERRTDYESGKVLIKTARIVKSVGDRAEDAYDYLLEASEEVPPEYTAKTVDECGRIENQLEKAFLKTGKEVEFAHQGSSTNNTHIRIHSDIDLLVIPTWFVFVDPALPNHFPYAGNPVADLSLVREVSQMHLADAFPSADVDDTGAKALAISGGSLARKVDVVSASWLDTERYRASGDIKYRGIEVLDAKASATVTNFPFLHNAEIERKDIESHGGYRRLVRMLKSIKADSDQDIFLSSYDICSLCYHVPSDALAEADGNSVVLSVAFLRFCKRVLEEDELFKGLEVPNGTRKIFEQPVQQRQALVVLATEVFELIQKAVGK